MIAFPQEQPTPTNLAVKATCLIYKVSSVHLAQAHFVMMKHLPCTVYMPYRISGIPSLLLIYKYKYTNSQQNKLFLQHAFGI